MNIPRRSLLLPAPLFAFPASGAEAPRFKAKSLEGEMFDNASVKGKAVLVQIWATWCGVCRNDQPHVDDAIDEFGGDGLVVLAVNAGESRRTVQSYLARSPRKGHVILTADTNLAAVFRAQGVPHYVLIDRDGKVEREVTGGLRSGVSRFVAGAVAKR